MMKFLQKTFTAFLLLFSTTCVQAQDNRFKNNCGSSGPGKAWESEFQKLVTQYTSKNTANKIQQTYVIPVIIHVIHGGQAVGSYPNLSQSQLTSQMVTLNNDFAGTGLNFANYPANAFATWAATANVSPASLDANGRVSIANCNIQFCLATKDTNGNILAEPGIDRINYNTMGWTNPAAPSVSSSAAFFSLYENTIKPQSIWNVSKYLNIWVSDIQGFNVGFVGYATYPYLSTLNDLPAIDIGSSTNDGVFCAAYRFGHPSHLATHEIGHWLGLWHTWGDSLCGNDYCNDTPPSPSPSVGSPTYPHYVNACGSSANGVMFMNYMDYSDNSAIYMFTTDQANRMQTAMANSPYRKYLGTHNLCSVETVSMVSEFYSLSSTCTGKNLSLYNTSFGWPAPTSYTWSTSGGTFSPGPQAISPSIQFSTPGVYTISLATSSGTVSVFSKTINVTSPTLYLSSTSQTICEGAVANFTVDGMSTYTWYPGNVTGALVSFTPTASQTYTCHGLEINNCTSTAIVEVAVEPCVGLNVYSGNELKLAVYPNPVKEMITLQINSKKASVLTLQITDAVGKIIYQEILSTSSKEKFFPLDISTFDNGIYFIKVQGADGFVKTEKFVKKG